MPSVSPATRRLLALLAALGTASTFTPLLLATDYYKANNETNLELPAAWEALDGTPSSTAPVNGTGSTDIFIWDSRVTATADGNSNGLHEVTVGSGKDLGVRTLRILNPELPVVFNGNGRTFTMTNTGGVDMANATQDLTLTNLFHRIAAANATVSLNVAAGRTLTYGTGAQINVNGNSSGTTLNINTDGVSSGTVTFAANVASSHWIIGTGHVEFNNAAGNSKNSTNTTTLNGGVTLVNNTSGSGTGSGVVTVNSGATLGGSGIISGAVTANSGAILSPGDNGVTPENNGVGLLRLGQLTLQPGSVLVWEGVNEADADRLNVTGADGLVINGTTVTDDADENHPLIRLYNPGTTSPFTGTGVFDLIGYSGAIGGAGLDALRLDPATILPGRTYSLGLGAGVITLEISEGIVTPIDWAVNASGNWSSGANWTGGVAPDAAKAIARITGETGATLTSPVTVTLDSPATVGKLYLESTQAVTLGGGTLAFDQGAGAATLFASGANHTISAPLALSAAGLIGTVDDTGQILTISSVISGEGSSLVKVGPGALLLTADNTYTGSTSVSAGTLQIGNGGTTGSVAGSIAVSGALRFNRSDSVTRTTAISGTGSVEFAGTGDTTLTVANTHSGPTNLTAGTLILAHAEALRSSTFTYSTTGGSLVVADPVDSVVLGGLAGDRAFPLANSSAAPIALTVGGNNASTTYTGSPSGAGLSFTKNGTGTLALSGTHTYTGNTTVNAGVLSLDTGSVFNTAAANVGTGSTAKILVNGGTLNASASSVIKHATAGLQVVSGTANFTGGLATDINVSSGTYFIQVSGGTLNASSINIGRSSLSQTSEPGSGQTAQGLYIHTGGAVSVSGDLNIGAASGANSTVSARMDNSASSLTVQGITTLGINNVDRWSVLDISAGTFNANGGIRLGSAYAGNVVMHIRGASSLVRTPGIQFGQAALAGRSYLNLAGGALYVGSDGLTLGSSGETFTPLVRFNGGTLGATANWSSTLPVEFLGTGTVTGADQNNTPYTVTLHGPASGSGDIVKIGSGTVLFTASNTEIFGPVNVYEGTLGLGGQVTFGELNVSEGAAFSPQGVFVASYGANVNGGLAFNYNAAAENPVGRLEAPFGLNLGANSSLVVSGTGVLPGGSDYVIVKALGGISGTFASVSLPAGFTLDYDYKDGSGIPAIAIVGSGVASPYDTWADSYSLSGEDSLPTADPDGDGMNNLLEYALDTDPTSGDTASAYTLGRSGNFLTLSFNHPGDPSLTYEIEATNDLGAGWTSVHTFDPYVTEGTEIYTDTADLITTPRRFIRLKVTKEL